MNTIYLTPNDPAAQSAIRLMNSAFPDYRGNKYKVRVQTTVNVQSSWSGGSRDYYAFVNLADGRATNPVPAQSQFDRPISGADCVTLPDGIGCVEHSIFCGKDMGLTLIVAPSNGPRFLPSADELPELLALCLIATASLKNSYGGETDIRFKRVREYLASRWENGARIDTGITLSRADWDAAVADGINRGYLTKAKSITPNGRNAIANHPLRNRIN